MYVGYSVYIYTMELKVAPALGEFFGFCTEYRFVYLYAVAA